MQLYACKVNSKAICTETPCMQQSLHVIMDQGHDGLGIQPKRSASTTSGTKETRWPCGTKMAMMVEMKGKERCSEGVLLPPPAYLPTFFEEIAGCGRGGIVVQNVKNEWEGKN